MNKILSLCIMLILIVGLSTVSFPACGYTEKYTKNYPTFSRADIPVTVSASDPTKQEGYDRLMKERWQQIGENLLLEASLAGEPVNTWSDIRKASFLYTCYMKSLHEAGAPVNHDQFTRFKEKVSSDASDDYACGWHELALSGIFEGAGITTGVPVMAGYWGTDLFPLTYLQPNNNHGVISLYDPETRRIVTFDPLQDGMQNGDSYDVGEESRFNGLDSDEWEDEAEKWGFTKYSINGGEDWYTTLQEQDILNEYEIRYSREKTTHDSSSDDAGKGQQEGVQPQNDNPAVQPADSSSDYEQPSHDSGEEEIPKSGEEEGQEPGKPSQENTLNGIPLSEWLDPDNQDLDLTRYTKPGDTALSGREIVQDGTDENSGTGPDEEGGELNTIDSVTFDSIETTEIRTTDAEDESPVPAEESISGLFGPVSSNKTVTPGPSLTLSSGGEEIVLIPPVCTLLLTPDKADKAYTYQVNNGEVTTDSDEIVPAYTIDSWKYDSYRMQTSFRGTIEGNRIEGSEHMIHHPQKSWGMIGSPGAPCTILFSFDVKESSTVILSPDGTYRWYATSAGGKIIKQWLDDCAAGGVEARTDVYPPNAGTDEYTGTWSIRE